MKSLRFSSGRNEGTEEKTLLAQLDPSTRRSLEMVQQVNREKLFRKEEEISFLTRRGRFTAVAISDL